MSRVRTVMLLLLVALVSSACGKKNKRQDDELVTDKNPVKSFLAPIPADTPFAFVAGEPLPLVPLLQWMKKLNYGGEFYGESVEQLIEDEYVDPPTKAMLVIGSALMDNLSADGLGELGLSASPRFAVYGIGLLPAVRFDLEDNEKFQQFVTQIEERSGLQRTDETLGDIDLWTYQVGDGVVVMSIRNNQLAAGFAPRAVAETYVPYLVGAEYPERSMADVTTLDDLTTKHGYQKYGAGFVDLERIAQIFLEPTPGLNDTIARGAFDKMFPPQASQTCVDETRTLVAKTPRLVFGYESWSTERIRLGLGLELTGDLGSELSELRTSTPLAGSEFAETAPAYVGFGFHVGGLLEMLQTRAAKVSSEPYECVWYGDLNRVGGEASMYGAAIPAMVNNLKGGAVALKGVRKQPRATGTTSQPGDQAEIGGPDAGMNADLWKVVGIAAVTTSNPIGLFEFLRSFDPAFMSLNMKPDGKPVPLPDSPTLEFLDFPHAVMTTDTLAVSSGDGMGDEAARLIANDTSENPFLVVAFDAEKLMEMAAESGGKMPTWRGVLSRTRLELDPRDAGIFLHADLQIP